MALQIKYAYISHTGRVRSNNEDNFWCCGDFMPAVNNGTQKTKTGKMSTLFLPVFAVFDGMGGESCGEMASYIASSVCGKWYHGHRREIYNCPEQYLMGLCEEMNEAVCVYAEENKINSMGSTASVMSFSGNYAYICNLGDSPILEMQGGILRQISTDHVMRGTAYGKAPLTQFVGIPEDYMMLEPSISHVQLMPGSRYLICSDGVTDMISNEELAQILQIAEPCDRIVDRIWNRAMEQGGRDNITMILCEVDEDRNPIPSLIEKIR